MEFTLDTFAKLAAPIITGVFGLLAKFYSDAKPKLVSYLLHSFAITTRNNSGPNTHPVVVHTHSIVVRNAGKKTANNVRIGHHFLPDFQMYPQLVHEVSRCSDQSAEILIPTLVPGEQVTIGYLYYPPQTYQQVNTYCKSDEVAAKVLNVVPMVPFSLLQAYVFWGLAFIGASSLLYWFIYLALAWAQSST